MKPKIIVYIACSLDGFIADIKGGVDWLSGHDAEYQGDLGYHEFIQIIDTIIMGKKTYESVCTLSPKQWVYENANTYVLSHTPQQNTSNIHFTNQSLETLLPTLLTQSQKNIWICGGADVIHQAMSLHLVDEYHIFTMPILIGKGISLFKGQQAHLELQSCTHENGIIHAHYHNRS